jgi:50S ribosomal subunit-associated GTPase HflX
MVLDKIDRVVKNEKNELVEAPIFKVVAYTNAGQFTLLTDETSGVNTKCEKFILDNWVSKE